MKRQCSAHAASTDARCLKQALRGSRYCLQHQSWGLNVLAVGTSLLVGALLGVLLQAAFDRAVESPEGRQLRELQSQLDESQQHPHLEVLLNEQPLFQDSLALIQTTNTAVPLTLAVHNTGTLSSRELLFGLRHPKAAAHLRPAPAWSSHAARFIGGAGIEKHPDLALITYRTDEMIPPGDALELPAIVLEDPVKNSPVIGFGLKADSDASKGELMRLHVVFRSGPESLTIHQMVADADLRTLIQEGVQQDGSTVPAGARGRTPPVP